MYKLPLSFTAISDLYRSFIPNETTFIKHCLTSWISSNAVPGEFHGFGGQYKSNVLVTFEFTVISGLYRYFIPNKTTFTKYCLTQWISKLPGSFEFHWVRQSVENFTGLVGIINAPVYKTEPIFTGLGHGQWSYCLFALKALLEKLLITLLAND